MTVSLDPTPDFQRDEMLVAAIRMCGLLVAGEQPTPEQIEGAAFHFNLALLELQSSGLILTTAERTTLTLTTGTAEYDLPSDIIDLELGQDDAIGNIIGPSGNVETIVKTMSRGEWMNLAVKTGIAGRPSRCYVEKQALTHLVFWPTPDITAVAFRYTKVRLLRGNDTGASTMDLKRTWAPYMTYATAAGVALDNSKTEQAQVFKAWSAEKLKSCQAGDKQHGKIRFRVGRNGRNW